MGCRLIALDLGRWRNASFYTLCCKPGRTGTRIMQVCHHVLQEYHVFTLVQAVGLQVKVNGAAWQLTNWGPRNLGAWIGRSLRTWPSTALGTSTARSPPRTSSPSASSRPLRPRPQLPRPPPPRALWGPRLTTRDTRYAYNSRSQETVVNPHNRVGITDTSSIT
jgi:hypothetical protein